MQGEIIFGADLLKKFLSLIPSDVLENQNTYSLTIVTCYFSPSVMNIIPNQLVKETTIYFDVHGLQSEIKVDAEYSFFGIEESKLFHPKIYFFQGDHPILMVSSSNFTNASLNNLEVGIILQGMNATTLWNKVLSNLEKLKKITGREKLNALISEKEGVINNRWRHQDKAVNTFIKKKFGILEMATGTGKTRTAIRIYNTLRKDDTIDGVVITTFGTDLLDQWHKEILLGVEQEKNYAVYRQYEKYKELSNFLINPDNSILLISKDFLKDLLNRKDNSMLLKKLLICDEVHHMGATAIRNELDGKLVNFPYRLGLSATPERPYDEEGDDFITTQIGPIIFEFGLKKAIKNGILCEFDYIPLFYELNEDDKERTKSAYSRYQRMKKDNPKIGKEILYIDLARVKKLSLSKVPKFQKYLNENPDILNRSIIFVETMEYGKEIQEVVISHQKNYHTYYGDDDRNNLKRFANNDLECLITCKRISEGIDIRDVNNVILFSTSRSKLETIQRIGRCLRIDPNNPIKRAKVIDFVIESEILNEEESEYEKSDLMRYSWLKDLSITRRE